LFWTFQAAPDRFGGGEIVNDIDAGDAAFFRPHRCVRRSAFDRGSHGHRSIRYRKLFTIFSFGRPSQGNVNKE
jgi:hypothetical protein